MTVRIIVLILILFLGFNFSRKTQLNKDYRKIYIRIISFILILQSGLRAVSVGSDTMAYYQSFQLTLGKSWSEIYDIIIDNYVYGMSKDPGYAVFEKAVSIFTSNYQVYLIVIAIIFFTALGNFIYKNTTRLVDVILAFVIYSVLFYSFFSITGHRQTIATAAALYGYELIKKKKIFSFFLLILIASTIHKSVLIFLPFYFIINVNRTIIFYRMVLLLFPLMMIYRNSISTYFKALGGYEDYGINEEAGTFTFTAIFLLISIMAIIRNKTILQFNPKAQNYYNAFTMALFFLPLTWVNPSAMRAVQYFSIFMMLFIPEIIHSFITISRKIKRDLTVVSIILLLLLLLKSNWNNPNGYAFFWQEMGLPGNY